MLTFIFTPVILLIIKLAVLQQLNCHKTSRNIPGTLVLINKLTPAKIHNVPKQISVLILNHLKQNFSLFDELVDFKFHPVTCVSFYHTAWTVPKYRSNSVYTSSYKRHRTVQYEGSVLSRAVSD